MNVNVFIYTHMQTHIYTHIYIYIHIYTYSESQGIASVICIMPCVFIPYLFDAVLCWLCIHKIPSASCNLFAHMVLYMLVLIYVCTWFIFCLSVYVLCIMFMFRLFSAIFPLFFS